MVPRNAPCHCGSNDKYKKCCLAKDQAQRKPRLDKDAVIVVMPTRGQVTYETTLALQANLAGVQHVFCTIGRKPIVEARNRLSNSVRKVRENNPFDFEPREFYALWVDDDAWFAPGTVSVMLEAMNARRDIDALFGKFGGRTPYGEVFAWRDRTDKDSFPKEGVDCAGGELVQVERAGFHFVLMRVSLLERLGENPFDLSDDSIGEDFAFCDRAIAAGAKLAVGMGMPILHIDPKDGCAYLPGMPAMIMDENSVRMMSVQHVRPDRSVKESERREYGMSEVEQRAQVEESKRQAELQADLEQRRAMSV